MTREINPSVYRLKNNRVQVSFYNPATKKRVRKKFKLLSEAQKFEQEIRTQFVSNANTNTSSAESVEIWMKRYLNLNPKAFILKLGRPLKDSFLKCFGSVTVMGVSQEDLLTWLKDFQQVRGLSVRTMPNIKSAVNQFFQFIVDSRALALNPMMDVKKIEGLPPKDRTVLSESEINELLANLKDISPDLIYPAVFLMARTGSRLGEILNLRWKDVHFELSAIQLLSTKNGEDRLIQVSPEVLEYLKTLPRIDENVMVSFYGKAWTRQQYRKRFNKIRGKVKFKKYWCNHVLRHSFATNYLIKGQDMTQLQKILGHKTLAMTVDLYGQIQAKDVHDISPFNF